MENILYKLQLDLLEGYSSFDSFSVIGCVYEFNTIANVKNTISLRNHNNLFCSINDCIINHSYIAVI